ncbi:uncharacterized protein LOC127698392 [Mytilus californianus]|uniref:uncharacterized protein LOC127698392 n=1 Tax=Mytilus californianus TaxID=6549 RepID=UPI0022473044|nr:uncharacterized protein LOC127698392 [Mytilus californianus]XP_052057804.1 uncharacterized protein LOC127698392 [Mytilus californianus]
MKQKAKKILNETMVCSKRRQMVTDIIDVKDKTKDTALEAPSNVCVENVNLNRISNEESSLANCGEITTLEHQSSEKEEKKPNKDLIISNSFELDDFTKEPPKEIADDSKEIVTVETDTENEMTSLEEKENRKKMSSPTSANGINSRTNQLSTIPENVKGEEKEIKNSSPNQTKVLKDKQSNPEVSGDKSKRLEDNLHNESKMTKEGSNVFPIIMPDTDSVVIKRIKDTNEPNKPGKSDCSGKVSSELNQRPLSSVSDPGYRSNSVSSQNSCQSSKKTKKVYSGIRFTKKELEYYLPKRSNFSCHEKALKDAGYDLEAMESKRRRRFTRKQNIKDKEIEEKLKEIEDVNTSPIVDVASHENEIKEPDDEQTEMERSNKPKRKGKRKDEQEVKVDHTVLLQYLKYVLDNREEYFLHKRQYIQQNTTLLNVDPACTIARFGRAFQRGQHGIITEPFLLEVTRGIKSNYGDTQQWVSSNKEKQTQGVPNLKPEIQETTIDEKDKTEYEKVKLKLDKWLKTITTAQLLKAKELSLKELGEEDKLQSQWWSTLQPCRYLRQRSDLE